MRETKRGPKEWSPPRDSHPEVEFGMLDEAGEKVYFKSFHEAAAFAFKDAMKMGTWKNFDVVAHSIAGARWWGGEDAVKEYRAHPMGVLERFTLKVRSEGAMG